MRWPRLSGIGASCRRGGGRYRSPSAGIPCPPGWRGCGFGGFGGRPSAPVLAPLAGGGPGSWAGENPPNPQPAKIFPPARRRSRILCAGRCEASDGRGALKRTRRSLIPTIDVTLQLQTRDGRCETACSPHAQRSYGLSHTGMLHVPPSLHTFDASHFQSTASRTKTPDGHCGHHPHWESPGRSAHGNP